MLNRVNIRENNLYNETNHKKIKSHHHKRNMSHWSIYEYLIQCKNNGTQCRSNPKSQFSRFSRCFFPKYPQKKHAGNWWSYVCNNIIYSVKNTFIFVK